MIIKYFKRKLKQLLCAHTWRKMGLEEVKRWLIRSREWEYECVRCQKRTIQSNTWLPINYYANEYEMQLYGNYDELGFNN